MPAWKLDLGDGGELRWNKMINKEPLTQLINPI
jgi:hypothetical protein